MIDFEVLYTIFLNLLIHSQLHTIIHNNLIERVE